MDGLVKIRMEMIRMNMMMKEILLVMFLFDKTFSDIND